MEIIVYPLLGGCVLLLLWVALGKPGRRRVDRLAMLAAAYQALIDLGQHAKQVIADPSTDAAAVRLALDRFQTATNTVALEPDAAEVYRLAADYCLVLRGAANARQGTPVSEEVLEVSYRDLQEAARESLSRMRRGEVQRSQT